MYEKIVRQQRKEIARLTLEQQKQILTLDDDVQLLPGHGPDTTVGWERRRNPFLQ